MINAIITQESTSEGLPKNTLAFRYQYGRLNSAEQRDEQKAFCRRYSISPVAFRARIAGTTRVSDTELDWFEKRVETYFQK